MDSITSILDELETLRENFTEYRTAVHVLIASQDTQLDAARALSAAVDAYLNAPTDRKAKEWGRFMQELAQANRRFKEAGNG